MVGMKVLIRMRCRDLKSFDMTSEVRWVAMPMPGVFRVESMDSATFVLLS